MAVLETHDNGTCDLCLSHLQTMLPCLPFYANNLTSKLRNENKGSYFILHVIEGVLP